MKKTKKRLKFPNGFGSIIFLHGNRRRPWAVRKSGKYLNYFTSYEDAIIFLADYNKQPTIYSTEQTFSEIYKLEMAERKKKISEKTAKGYESAVQHCKILWNKKLKVLYVKDLQNIISNVSARDIGQPTQKKIRQIFHNIYRYAVKYQLISPNADISAYVDIDIPKRKYKKTPFNTRQLNRVKSIADGNTLEAPWAKCVLMMCYSGARPSEFLAIRKEDVKLTSRFYRIRDSKTAAGRNRLVPINRKTLPYYVYWMQQPGKTLITDLKDTPISYHKFLRIFEKVMIAARCKHKPHECRHTCATMLDNKGANKLSIKKILGHATQDITDGVYTHKDLRQLKKAIDLL